MPPRNEGLYRPAFRHEAGTLVRGRWALIAVRQETTEADVCAELRAIQKVIGKRHRDTLEREQHGEVTAWLQHSRKRDDAHREQLHELEPEQCV